MILQKQIGKLLGIRQPHVSMILNGKRKVTYTMAERLFELTHIKESFWMKAGPEELKEAFGDLKQNKVA